MGDCIKKNRNSSVLGSGLILSVRILILTVLLTAVWGIRPAFAAASSPAGSSQETLLQTEGSGAAEDTEQPSGSEIESQSPEEAQETVSREQEHPEDTRQQDDPVKPPAKPGVAKIRLSSHSSRAYLTWDKVKNASWYYVYRRLSGKKGYTRIAKTSKTKYTDKKVKAGKTYVYKVRAVHEAQGQNASGKASRAAKILISAIRPNKKMIALTFDDGPGPYTKAIVNCLRKYGMHATFFVVGNRVDTYKSALKAAYQAGCEIGNHSWNHANLASLSASDIRSQIVRTNKRVKAITGKKPALMRPPYGSVNARVRQNVKMPLICWSVDTLDWKTRSKSATVSSVMEHARDGQIVLMHDIHSPTRDAALTLIPRLVKKGYQLVTVSELAGYKGKKLKKGTVYYSIR